METYEFSAMNTRVVLAAEGEPSDLAPGFERTRDYVDRCAAQCTRFDAASELSALNRAAGTWFNATTDFYVLMQEAYALHVETNGLFDPAILNALEGVGYDASIELVRARTNSPRVFSLGAHDFASVSFHPSEHAIWMPQGMRIDLGGIAKGWIAEHAAHILAEYSDACAVNAGGDLFVIGQPCEGGVWNVEMEDPYDAAQTIAVANIASGAVATSAVTKRKWKQDRQERHHLIDPRTGLPAETDWLSVTVLAPHTTVAEVYAKALLIAGSAGSGELAAGHDEIEFIAVDRNRRLWGSEHAGEFLDGTGRFE